MTLEELNVIITAKTKQFKKDIDNVQNDVRSMRAGIDNEVNKIKNAFKGIGRIIATIGLGKFFKDSVSEALKVEASIQQIQRQMGESSNQFLKWAKTQALAFNMSQGDAMRYGAIFSNLVRGYSRDTEETFKRTQDLLKATAIISSGTGRTMKDTLERIRSGLLGNTEAIEDLGINVNVAMLESSKAFAELANGRSWGQLDYNTQSQIRLMAILEQTYSKFGDSVANNVNSQIAQFTAQLRNIQLNIGNAFMPILKVVMPILNAFAGALVRVTSIIAQFTTALFGKASTGGAVAQPKMINTQSKAIGGLGNNFQKAGREAKKAGKEFKGALLGIDELNILKTNASSGGSPSGGGGSVGGGGIPSIDVGAGLIPSMGTATEEISAKVQAMADKVKFVLSELFVPLKNSWETYGGGVMEQIEIAKTNTIATFENVKNTLVAIWYNGGSQIVENVAGIALNLAIIAGRIYNEFILPIVNWFVNLLNPETNRGAKGVLDGVNKMLEGIKKFTEYLAGDGFKYVKAFLALFTTWKATSFLLNIAQMTGAVISNTAAIISNTLAMAKNTLSRSIDFVKSLVTGVIHIGKHVTALVSEKVAIFAVTTAQKALNFAMNLNPITKVIALLGALGGAFTILYNKVAWFRNGVNSILNSIIRGINVLIRGLNRIRFNTPSWIPFIGGKSFSFNIPQLNYLAKGGVVDKPTLSMVGERGKEVVMPLENNTGWIAQLASQLGAFMGGNSTSTDSPIYITVKVGDSNLGTAVIKSLKEMTRQTGGTVVPI